MRTRVVPVIRKECLEIRRDPITLWIAFAFPLVLLFLFGYAIRLEVDNVPMAVLDLDRTPSSARLVDGFVNTGDFVIRRRPANLPEIESLLDAGIVRLALVIPVGFGRELAEGRIVPVQTLVDGTFSARAIIIRNLAEGITASFTAEQVREALGSPPLSGGVGVESRVWYNPALESRLAVIPGLFAVILMAFPPLLTVLAIVREKESGSVQQIYVSPLRPWEFIAGKMLPYVAIALLQLGIVIVVGVWWFRIPFRGSALVLGSSSLLYVFCTVGVGLLVSTLTNRQVVALFLALIITIMPSFLFSGFMYPISAMPETVQWYTRLFPVRYFTEISRGVFLKGVGLEVLWTEIALLAAYTAVVFAAASALFRKKLA